MSEQKDYYVKKVESTTENKDTKIASNVVFAVAGFILAGVAFGIGDQIFNDTSLQYLAAFGGVGISSANIRSARQKLATKKETITNSTQYSKGRK